jgi:hypothetical protein
MDNIYESNPVGELIKKWSDKPLYENQPKTSEYYERKFSKSAPSPSPILMWYLEELPKQEQQLQNEIDINHIKAALRGVKNEWFLIIKKDPEKFASMFDHNDINWKVIMEFRNART